MFFENLKTLKEKGLLRNIKDRTSPQGQHILYLLLIAIVGIAVYSNTFHVPFHFDDTPNIVENSNIKNLSNFWPPSGSRWLGFLTFALNYYFGGLNVTGYHIVNLIIHIFNAILVYWLVVLTFRTPYFLTYQKSLHCSSNPPTPPLVKGGEGGFALFSALLFVSHPIQTQAVTYIVQRFTSLATFFYLLSVVMYIKWRLITSQQSAISRQRSAPHPSLPLEGGGQGRGWRLHATRYTLYAVSILSAILAMKTKEISFTLPFIIILYEFCFFSKSPDSDPESSSGRTMNLRRLLYLLPFLLTLFIIPLSLIGTDKPIGDLIGDLSEATKGQTEMSRLDYLFTQFRVIITYIRLVFLPINQNLDYDYPIYNSFLNPNVFLSFLFLLLLFATAIYLLYRSRFRTQNSEGLNFQPATFNLKLISFGIFWFFITLSVESSIIPIRDVIFEHRLYLPSVGIIIAFSTATFYVLQFTVNRSRIFTSYFPLPTSYFLLLSTIVIALSIATYQRNTVWQDEVSLWEDVVRKSPEKARGYNNLGVWGYYKQRRVDDAIQAFQKALKLKPDYAEAHNNLGNIYYLQGHLDEAVQEYITALRLKPDFSDAHNNLGAAYEGKGLLDEAVKEYHTALRLNPEFKAARNNLNRILQIKR